MPQRLWAYAYHLDPPQPASRLAAFCELVVAENLAAAAAGYRWTGRMVFEKIVTRLLIISDSPVQHRDINRRLEAELLILNAPFSLTAPMAIDPTN